MGTTALLSFEEFEHLPAEPGKDELLDGELFHLPPAIRIRKADYHDRDELDSRLLSGGR